MIDIKYRQITNQIKIDCQIGILKEKHYQQESDKNNTD